MEREPVKLATIADNIQVGIASEALKNNGIASYTKDTDTEGFLDIYVGGSFSSKAIYVAEEDVERAREVLIGIGIEEF